MRQTNGLAAQRKAVGGMANRGWPAAMHAVEFHQQRVLLRVAHRVIQQHDLAARAGIDQVAQREFADAAQAVKRDSDHWLRSFFSGILPKLVDLRLQRQARQAGDGQFDKGRDPAAQCAIGLRKDKRLFSVGAGGLDRVRQPPMPGDGLARPRRGILRRQRCRRR